MTQIRSDELGALAASVPAPAGASAHYARVALGVLLACVGYYMAGILAFALRLEHGGISDIWLPHGVMLAALILTSPRHWWLYVAALLPVHLHLASHFQGPIPLPGMLIHFTGNVVQAVIGAMVVQRAIGVPPRLDAFRPMTVFLGFGVIVPVAAAAAVVAGLFVATGALNDFWLVWQRRTLAGVSGAVALTPVILAVAAGGLAAIRAVPRPRRLEYAALTIGVLALVMPAFTGESQLLSQRALLFAPLPLLFWVAVRFGPGGLSPHVLLVVLAVLTATKAGYGPFVAASAAESVLSVQAYLLSISIPLLMLGALVAERGRANEALRERLAFERLVSEISASLINPPPAQADEALEAALQKVVVAMDIDRCSVFQYRRERYLCRITHNAQSARYPPVRRDIEMADLPWLLRQLQAGVTVVVGEVERDFPPEATAERRYVQDYGSRSWVVVPVTVGDEVVRSVSFHSLRQREWTADVVARLQLVAEIFISALTSTQANAALRERLAFERLVSEITASLINPPPAKADEALEAALHKVVVATGIDRCSVFQYHPGRRSCRITHSAESAGYPTVRREIDFGDFPWVLGRLRAGVTVVMNDLERDLPPEAAADRRYVEGYGSRSAVAVPVTVGDDVVRAVSFHSLRQREWTPELVSNLQLLAEIFISALTSTEAKAALRESEERLQLALAAGRMGAWDWDRRRDTLAWSKEHFPIFGLAPFSIVPTQEFWASRLHPDDLPRAHAALAEAIAQRKEYRCEYRVAWPDGSLHWVEACADPVYDERGECVRIMGLVVDISERKRAEAALQASEERYRGVVESQTELVCRYRPDTTLTFVNEAYCRFFGQSREGLIGTKFVELVPEPARATVLDHVASLVANPRVHTYEHEVTLADGAVRWQQWVDSPIVAQDGRVAELQGIGRDITDRKRAEEANQKLAHASRLAVMGELTASIAHEINQPLGAILANADAAELLLEAGPRRLDEVRRILADIRKDDLRASEVVRRIRELVRSQQFERQPLDLNEIVADVLKLLGADAARRGVALEAALAPGLPVVRGDRVHLQQVLLNLLLNGMDAVAEVPAPRRRVVVRTALNGGGVEVSVTDAGTGIPSAQLPRLFESFFTTKKDGMGLGLSIARSIVEAHGGRIWAENRPEGGGAFRFTVPGGPVA